MIDQNTDFRIRYVLWTHFGQFPSNKFLLKKYAFGDFVSSIWETSPFVLKFFTHNPVDGLHLHSKDQGFFIHR